MSQKTITVGTAMTPADLDVNFENSQDNFTELYTKNTTQDTAIGGKENYHGVASVGVITFDNASHILSIASITYWHQGVQFTSATPVTCDIDTALTLTPNTLYYFYFDDATGSLVVSTSFWNLHLHVPVALVMWNGTVGAVMGECHSHTRDIDWHINAHLTIGARYYSGLALTTPTVATPGSLSITGGTLYDEDIAINVSNPQTAMRGWYQAGAGVYSFTDFALPYLGTLGQPQYLDTDTYTLTNVAVNDYVSMWVYAGNDVERPIYIIPTQAAAAHNTVAEARAEKQPNLIGLNISPELKLLYKFIYKGDGSFIESVDYRSSSSLPAGGTAAVSAASVTFVPTEEIASADVQGAIENLSVFKGLLSESGTITNGGYDFAQDSSKTWAMDQWLGHKAVLFTSHGNYEVSIYASGEQGFGFEPPVGAMVSDSAVVIDDDVETGVLNVVGVGELSGAAGNGASIILVQGAGNTATDTVTWDDVAKTLTIVVDSDGVGTPRAIMAGNIESLINTDPSSSMLFLATMGTAGNLVAGTYTLAGGVDGNMADGSYLIYNFQKDITVPFDVGVYAPGVLTDAMKLLKLPIARTVTFPADFTGSYAVGTEATAETILSINKNGSSVGSITFAAAGTTGIFASTGGAAVSFAAGDMLSVDGPATADATLADVGVILAGTR